MVESIKGTGLITLCMEKEFIAGLMVEYIKDNTMLIESTDSAHIHGRTVENTQAVGKMENSMARQYILSLMALKK